MKRCLTCRHFDNDPRRLEAVFRGLSALSSADASVRADDGLCALHDRYLAAAASCDRHQERVPPSRPAR